MMPLKPITPPSRPQGSVVPKTSQPQQISSMTANFPQRPTMPQQYLGTSPGMPISYQARPVATGYPSQYATPMMPSPSLPTPSTPSAPLSAPMTPTASPATTPMGSRMPLIPHLNVQQQQQLYQTRPGIATPLKPQVPVSPAPPPPPPTYSAIERTVHWVSWNMYGFNEDLELIGRYGILFQPPSMQFTPKDALGLSLTTQTDICTQAEFDYTNLQGIQRVRMEEFDNFRRRVHYYAYYHRRMWELQRSGSGMTSTAGSER
eukprot:TRINITY_DN4315_c0_g1_i1.p1 TRINITY_DN4315_c0_g1~~TRINITY_DN4315_c0_g1_i1.p1  ORF type:complete len:261 (-),score=26.39 TRINITY_DN4315_c0_g1_i1:159-941(-)